MMTNILKFRAWHKEYKKWCEPYSWTIEDWMNISFSSIGLTVHDEDGDCESASYKDIEITQWTGLTDAIGKDIYDCDIIEYSGLAFEYYEEFIDGEKILDFKGRIEFHYNGALIIPIHSGCAHLLSRAIGPDMGSSIKYNSVKIIGNIHKNSELMGLNQ